MDDIEKLKNEVTRLSRVATDRSYMLHAYRNMLGPVALKVAAMWDEKGVQRVHYDWAEKASTMTGEERAQFILDVEAAPATEVWFDGDTAVPVISPSPL